MDITATITLADDEARAFLRELQVAQLSDPTLTANELADKLLRKLLQGWSAENRKTFLLRNRPAIEQIIGELAVDPDRNTKLAGLGYEFSADGTLRKLPEEPAEEPVVADPGDE